MTYQISVFLENKLGQLEKVTRVLTAARINIRAVYVNHTANGWGILNLVVSDPQYAQRCLDENGFTAALRRVLAVRMADRPGSLDELLTKVVEAGVNFENAYGMTLHESGTALFVIDVNDIPDAEAKLLSTGLAIVGDDVVYGRPTGWR